MAIQVSKERKTPRLSLFFLNSTTTTSFLREPNLRRTAKVSDQGLHWLSGQFLVFSGKPIHAHFSFFYSLSSCRLGTHSPSSFSFVHFPLSFCFFFFTVQLQEAVLFSLFWIHVVSFSCSVPFPFFWLSFCYLPHWLVFIIMAFSSPSLVSNYEYFINFE